MLDQYTQNTGEERNGSFHLTGSNWLCTAFAIGALGAVNLGLWGGVSQPIGVLVGIVVACLAMAVVAALITWLLGGRARGGGSFIYNTVLIISVVVIFRGRLGADETNELAALREVSPSTPIERLESSTEAELTKVPEKASSSVASKSADADIANAHAEAVTSFFEEYNSEIRNWNQELDQLKLEYGAIKRDSARISAQIDQIKHFRESLDRLKRHLNSMEERFRSKIGDLDQRYPLAGESMGIVRASANDIQRSFGKLAAKHDAYALTLLRILYRLRQHPNLWKYQRGEAIFESNELLVAHNRDIDALNAIARSSEPLVKEFNDCSDRLELEYYTNKAGLLTQHSSRYRGTAVRWNR